MLVPELFSIFVGEPFPKKGTTGGLRSHHVTQVCCLAFTWKRSFRGRRESPVSSDELKEPNNRTDNQTTFKTQHSKVCWFYFPEATVPCNGLRQTQKLGLLGA